MADGEGATPDTTGATPDGETDGNGDDSATETGDDQLGEAGQKALAAERDARKAADRRAKAAEERLAAIERGKLPEQERIVAERDDYKTQLETAQATIRRLTTESAVVTAATKMGVVDPDVAVALLERGGNLEFDKDGTPTNVKELLKDLIKERPHLTRAHSTPDGEPGAGSRTETRSGDFNDQLRRAAGRNVISTG